MPERDQSSAFHWSSVALRVLVFACLSLVGLFVLGFLLQPLGLLVAATISVFGAAALATAIALRIYENRPIADVGLGWHAWAGRHVATGLGVGALGAVFVVGFPLLIGKASIVASPSTPFNAGSLALVVFVLFFGAIGEELLFRGFGFQVMAGAFGTYKVLLPIAVVFAAAHAGNAGFTALGLLNTFLWGVLLGYATLRSGDLWLPIGLHYGWNVTLPLFGVNLSGFTMGLTGYTVEWKANEWWSGGAYGPEGSILSTMAVVALGYALHRLPIRPQRLPLLREEQYEDPGSP